jgi:FkbM family methyltransferase
MIIPMSTLIAKYGARPKGIIHLGAYVGEEAAEYKAAGAERVLWVEAVPEAFRQLQENIKGLPGHCAFQAAVSDVDDVDAGFRVMNSVPSSSLLPLKLHLVKYPGIVETQVIPVKTVTVDTLIKRNGIDPKLYDFLAMDLQGGEMKALLGMKECLPSIRGIYTEINAEELYEGCTLLPEFTAYLHERGFDLKEVKLWSETDGWGDAFYART